MKKNESIHIGTSGWHYEQWRGAFYPERLAAEDFLKHYATRFQTVEITDHALHQTTRERALVQWRDSVPQGFIFSVKANHYITHMKGLKDPQQTVPPFLRMLDVLGEKLGPILFQLPMTWTFSVQRLQSFLKCLGAGHKYVFEFRNPNCFNSQIYDLLQDYGAAFCIYDLGGQVSPKMVTTDLVYVRLRCPGILYPGQHDTRILSGWADVFSGWIGQGKEIYCYFDNDQEVSAPQDAARLRSIIESRGRLQVAGGGVRSQRVPPDEPEKPSSEEVLPHVQGKIGRHRR